MLEVNHTIDRYVIEAELGAGGMATVYRVRHATLGSLHALKVLHVEGRAITERLLAEGRVQAGLDHPNALVVTDVIDVDGQPGLIMEYVPDGTLEDWVLTDPSRAERLAVFRAVCSAVAAAHDTGFIHRDLKPANVMVKRSGGRVVPKVADFGLVKAVAGDQPRTGPRTRKGMPMGTPGYMAPEQIESAAGVDARADVYSLGCILVWLLTGREAFEGESVLELFANVAAGRHRSLPEDDPLRPVVQCALASDPGARFADAGALLAALDAPGSEAALLASPSRPRRAPATPLPVWGVLAALLLGAAVFTGAIAFVVAIRTVASSAPVTVPEVAGCPVEQGKRLGWVRGTLPAFTSIPNPYVLDAPTPVYTELTTDSDSVCTLPEGTSIEVRRKSRRPLNEVFWLAVEGDAVTLP